MLNLIRNHGFGILIFVLMVGLGISEAPKKYKIDFGSDLSFADSLGEKVTITTSDGKPVTSTNPLPTTATLSGASMAITDGAGTTIGIASAPFRVDPTGTTNQPTLPKCAVVSTPPTYSAGTNQQCTMDSKGNTLFSAGTAWNGSPGNPTPDSIQIYGAPSTTYAGGLTGFTGSTQLFPADSAGFITTVQNVGTPAVEIAVCPFTPATFTSGACFHLVQYQYLPSLFQMTWKGVLYAITGGSLGTASGVRLK